MTVAYSRNRNPHDESGFTLVEVLVAAFLLMGGFAMLVNTLVSMNNASRRNDERELASIVAFNYIEKVRALGCGLATGSETPAELDALAAKCPDELGLGDPSNSFYDAGGTFVTTDTTGAWTDSAVRVRMQPWTTWDVAAAGDTCSAVAAAPNTVVYPDSVLRTVQVLRRETTAFSDAINSYTVRETVSPDRVTAAPQSTGAIVITGFDGDHAAVAAMDFGTHTVQRRSGGRNCVWLPFVPAGAGQTVTLSAADGSGTIPLSLTVNAGQTTIVACAAEAVIPSAWCA